MRGFSSLVEHLQSTRHTLNFLKEIAYVPPARPSKGLQGDNHEPLGAVVRDVTSRCKPSSSQGTQTSAPPPRITLSQRPPFPQRALVHASPSPKAQPPHAGTTRLHPPAVVSWGQRQPQAIAQLSQREQPAFRDVLASASHPGSQPSRPTMALASNTSAPPQPRRPATFASPARGVSPPPVPQPSSPLYTPCASTNSPSTTSNCGGAGAWEARAVVTLAQLEEAMLRGGLQSGGWVTGATSCSVPSDRARTVGTACLQHAAMNHRSEVRPCTPAPTSPSVAFDIPIGPAFWAAGAPSVAVPALSPQRISVPTLNTSTRALSPRLSLWQLTTCGQRSAEANATTSPQQQPLPTAACVRNQFAIVELASPSPLSLQRPLPQASLTQQPPPPIVPPVSPSGARSPPRPRPPVSPCPSRPRPRPAARQRSSSRLSPPPQLLPPRTPPSGRREHMGSGSNRDGVATNSPSLAFHDEGPSRTLGVAVHRTGHNNIATTLSNPLYREGVDRSPGLHTSLMSPRASTVAPSPSAATFARNTTEFAKLASTPPMHQRISQKGDVAMCSPCPSPEDRPANSALLPTLPPPCTQTHCAEHEAVAGSPRSICRTAPALVQPSPPQLPCNQSPSSLMRSARSTPFLQPYAYSAESMTSLPSPEHQGPVPRARCETRALDPEQPRPRCPGTDDDEVGFALLKEPAVPKLGAREFSAQERAEKAHGSPASVSSLEFLPSPSRLLDAGESGWADMLLAAETVPEGSLLS